MRNLNSFKSGSCKKQFSDDTEGRAGIVLIEVYLDTDLYS